MAITKFSNMDKARAQLVLDHPFVASILLRRPMVETRDIPTLGVDAKARIYYNPDFVAKLTVPQLIWGLAHEVFHVVGQHAARVGTRSKQKWNYAGDAWINDTLDEAKIGERIPKTVNMPGSRSETVENIYDKLPDNDQQGKGQGQGQGQQGQGQGQQQGQGQGDNDGLGEDVIYGDGQNGGKPLTKDEIREIEATVKVEIAEAAQAAKMRGKLPGCIQDIVTEILDVKTPWFDILEKHCTARVQQGISWRRPNRRYEDFYLPSPDKMPQMGVLVLQVDVSGSVSKKELDYYGGHFARIVEQCRPEKVHVIYTDTQVQKHVEFACGEEPKLEFYSGGGTHMPAGFDWCAEEGIVPDVFVCLTDGYTDFGDDPGYPVVWCISSDKVSPHGENVHFEMV